MRSLVSGSQPPRIDCVYQLIAGREASTKPAQAAVLEVEIDALHVERGVSQHSVDQAVRRRRRGQIGGLVGKLQFTQPHVAEEDGLRGAPHRRR